MDFKMADSEPEERQSKPRVIAPEILQEIAEASKKTEAQRRQKVAHSRVHRRRCKTAAISRPILGPG